MERLDHRMALIRRALRPLQQLVCRIQYCFKSDLMFNIHKVLNII